MVAHESNVLPKLRHVRLLFAVLISTLVASCGNDPTSSPEEPHTIDELLADWEAGYANGDLEKYVSVFADDFVFISDPGDQALDPNFPSSWDADHEKACLEGLYGHVELDTLTLRVHHQTTSVPDPTDGPFPTGTIKVVLSATVEALLTYTNTGDEWGVGGGGEQWLFLRRNDKRTRAGEPMWEIFEWREDRDGFGLSPRIVPSWGWMRDSFSEE